MRHLIALDVDGTLLDTDRHIRPRVKAAIYAAIGQGHIVTLATGRRFRSAKGVAEELGLAVPLIMNQGALVYDMQQREALYQRTLDPNFIRQAVGLVCEAGYSPGVFQSPELGEYIYIGPPENDSSELRYYATEPRRADLIRRLDYAAMPSIELPLVVMAIGPTTQRDSLSATLTSGLVGQFFSYSLDPVELSHFSAFDIIPPDVSKGRALLFLAQYFGIRPENTLAIGDGHNDIEMLKAAGIGIAMGNAEAAVQAAADYITATNDEDGVALAIEQHILKDE